MLGFFRRLCKLPLLRRFVLPVFAKCNPGDIRIRHHYTGKHFLLHSFRHKGYWFHGRRRERETMEFFTKAIQPGDRVIEVGGHIGYMSMFFADLVGPTGHVTVFEPGSNNLPYLESNVENLANVELIAKAVSDQDGAARFFEEELTGQNNSLHADYEVFSKNCELAFTKRVYHQREVETVRLDTFLQNENLQGENASSSLLKIDVEGAELQVLQGGQQMITSSLPIIMVEITHEKPEAYRLLSSLGYTIYNDEGQILTSPEQIYFNVCALHPIKHAELIKRCGWNQVAAAA